MDKEIKRKKGVKKLEDQDKILFGKKDVQELDKQLKEDEKLLDKLQNKIRKIVKFRR